MFSGTILLLLFGGMVWEYFRLDILDAAHLYPKPGLYGVDQATGTNNEILRVDLIHLDSLNPNGKVLGMKQYYAIRRGFGTHVVVGRWGQMVWTDDLSYARDVEGMIDTGRPGWW